MWPLGHLAIGYLLYAASTRLRLDAAPTPPAIAAVVMGSLAPDLVDKPLAWYLGVLPTGRSLAHSLVVLVPVVLLIVALARRYRRQELAVAFAIGAVAHVLVDAVPALWREDASAGFLLYPLVSVEPYDETGPPTVFGLLTDQLASPWFHLEFVLAAATLVLWSRQGRPGWDEARSWVSSRSRRDD